ncbi:MAG: Fic family protein [Gemmatimonadaceae bacterium]
MATPLDRFLPDLSRQQTAELLRLVGELGDFKGHWHRVGEVSADRLAGLRQVTTIESTASSTRIEGAELSDAEVAQVLEGVHVDSFRRRDEEEVRGYGELLTLIYDSHAAIPLAENHLKQLHSVLLRHSAKDERHRGEYKKLRNDVAATHLDGRREVLFETASPFDTPRLMAELVAETNEAFERGDVHTLVVIARFIVDFLAIHPFQDGNGRLARAVTSLLLLRMGYDYVPYASLERIIEENKAEYYAALRSSQLAMRENPAAFGDWLIFFLHALRSQQQSLDLKIQVERSMLQISELQQQIVEFVQKHGRATTTAIRAHFDIPRRTVRYHLDILRGRGLVKAHGERKGRYYTPATSDQAAALTVPEAGTNIIIAEIYQRGGRIGRRALRALVKQHGYHTRTVGTLHGRRLAHLRRDPKTGESVLTSRGSEAAQHYIFASRLAERAREGASVEGLEIPRPT